MSDRMTESVATILTKGMVASAHELRRGLEALATALVAAGGKTPSMTQARLIDTWSGRDEDKGRGGE